MSKYLKWGQLIQPKHYHFVWNMNNKSVHIYLPVLPMSNRRKITMEIKISVKIAVSIVYILNKVSSTLFMCLDETKLEMSVCVL